MSASRKIVETKFTEDIDGPVTSRPSTNGSEESLNKKITMDTEIRLTWRSWMVVLVTCFAQAAQVFVVAGSGQVIAFIAQDLGDAKLASWIIQAPLLMQSVLSPVVGRLSDFHGRRWLVSLPAFVAFVGAIVSATATSMPVLIGGGVLIGVTLSTLSILQSIPSEVLPLKYRAVSNGAGFLGSAVGGIAGSLGGGAVTNLSISGWRYIFWIQAALHGVTCVSMILLYNPPTDKSRLQHRRSWQHIFWSIDPIGSVLFMCGTTLTLLGLNWVGSYSWSDAHVVSPLTIGLATLLAFAIYEWDALKDGIVAHAFFQNSPNFALAIVALACEGFVFYGAVNTIVPQIILHLGFENNAWSIAVRQLSSSATTIVACLPVIWYATRYKDPKTPLLVTFGIFLAATICYSLISPEQSSAQIGYNILVAVGQSGPLILLVAIVQLAAPHEYLSTATGLAFSVRAIGGAFGTAILNAIINSKLNSTYADEVGNAARNAGLPLSSVDGFVREMMAGDFAALGNINGVNNTIIVTAMDASEWAYARAYRIAWASIIPFIVVAIICVLFMKRVGERMTNEVEASVEPASRAMKQEDTA